MKIAQNNPSNPGELTEEQLEEVKKMMPNGRVLTMQYDAEAGNTVFTFEDGTTEAPKMNNAIVDFILTLISEVDYHHAMIEKLEKMIPGVGKMFGESAVTLGRKEQN